MKQTNLLKRLGRNVAAFAHHPRRITCLECGFLALDDKEVSTADRIRLHMRGTAGGCPSLEKLCCFRSLWVNFDLSYCGVPPADEIFDMVQKSQRNCKGFFRYRSGWSPSGHQDLLLKSLEWKQKLFFAVLGSGLTLFAAWLAKLFGLR